MPNSRLVTRDHNQGHEYLITTSVAQQSGPRDSVPTDPDSEFIEGAYAEDELQSLDFDDAAGSQILHDREPESDFATLDDNIEAFVDVADASDHIEDVDLLGGVDMTNEDPL